jgi:hypothetical protein
VLYDPVLSTRGVLGVAARKPRPKNPFDLEVGPSWFWDTSWSSILILLDVYCASLSSIWEVGGSSELRCLFHKIELSTEDSSPSLRKVKRTTCSCSLSGLARNKKLLGIRKMGARALNKRLLAVYRSWLLCKSTGLGLLSDPVLVNMAFLNQLMQLGQN